MSLNIAQFYILILLCFYYTKLMQSNQQIKESLKSKLKLQVYSTQDYLQMISIPIYKIAILIISETIQMEN